MQRIARLCIGAVALLSVTAADNQNLRRLDVTTVSNGTTDSAKEFSQKALKFLTNLRGGDADFYKKLVTTLQILMCQSKVAEDAHPELAEGNAVWSGSDETIAPYHRFVKETSGLALKNSTGGCVYVLNPEQKIKANYNAGYCEVKENCYWKGIDPTSLADRAPKYSILQGVQPADGEMRLTDANDFIMTYAKGFGATVIPSIILLVLSVLSIILFIICRCCCNKCGGRSGKPGGYALMEKLLPILFYLLFAIAILVLAALSYVYYGIVTTSVSSIFTIILDLISTITIWLGKILAPLKHIGDTVKSSATTISTQLDNSGFIEAGLDGITTRLNAFATQTNGVTLPRGCVLDQDLFCTACQVCTDINTQVTSVNSQISLAAGSGVASLKKTRTDVKTLLVGASDMIADVVQNAFQAQDTLNTDLKSRTQPVSDFQVSWNSNTVVTKYGIIALFALAIVVIVLGILGILFGLTPLRVLVIIMHLAYTIAFIAIIITFLLSAVFIAISVLLADVCQVSYIISADWTIALGEDAKIVNACFQNTSLADVLDLTPQFAFATDISFPKLNLGTMLDFSSFTTFSNSISSTTTNTFQFDSAALQQYLDLLNSQTSVSSGSCIVPDGRYTISNILTPWTANAEPAPPSNQPKDYYIKNRYTNFNSLCTSLPRQCMSSSPTCTYSDYVAEIWRNVSTLRTIQIDAVTFVDDMKTSMRNLGSYIDTFKQNITDLSTTLTNIGDDLGGTLIKDVDTIITEMKCTFVADTYTKLSNEFCVNMVPSFLMISLFLFLMGIFLIPVIITLIIMVKRLRYKYTLPGEADTKFK